jgi:hypothetical protein
MNDLLVISAVSVGVPSIAWTVVSIRRLAVMQRIIEHALNMSTQAQIPNVLHESADLASTLTSDLHQLIRMNPPRRRLCQPPELLK